MDTYPDGKTPDFRAGMTPHWRAIRDDGGRIMVAICHNIGSRRCAGGSDEALSGEVGLAGYRIAMNYFVYDLTH